MSFFHSNSVKKKDHDSISKIVTFIWQWDVFDLLFIGMLALPFVLIWFVPPENLAAFCLAVVVNNIGLSILAFCFAVDLRSPESTLKYREKPRDFSKKCVNSEVQG